jgi:hypothetical protein
MRNLKWWMGVVEDRDDPEQLGRCKVRIFGLHTENLGLLPTDDLPWAVPMQPITSAATSGVGSTPVGIVPGAWVVGFFMDGEECQQPVIMGTIAGKPKDRTPALSKQKQDIANQLNVKRDIQGNPVYDGKGTVITVDSGNTSIQNQFTPLVPSDLTKIFNYLGKQLSNDDYSKEGEYGELGRYQFTVSNLIDLGYIQYSFLSDVPIGKALLESSNNWTGKNGITSKKLFLASKKVQDDSVLVFAKDNYDTMVTNSKIKPTDNAGFVAGLIATAHLVGPNYADNLDRKNSYGQRIKKYFVDVNAIFGDNVLGANVSGISVDYTDASNYFPIPKDEFTDPEFSNITGFTDPNNKYPKYEYLGLSDINKLAIGDTTHSSLKVKTNQKITNIETANSEETWDEPDSAFMGLYPYNQVIETEAGHVIELDNTPNAERIHVFHKSGSYIEIDSNGTMVKKTVGDNYEIVDRNNSLFVKGAQRLTVEGKTSIYVKDNASIEVDGDVSLIGHGDALIQTAGNMKVAAKSLEISATNALNFISDGPVNIQGSAINLYSKGGMTAKSLGDFSIQSSGTMSIKGSVSLLLDAPIVKTKMGANLVKAIVYYTAKLPTVRNPDKTILPYLNRTNVRPSSDGTDIAGLTAGQVAATNLTGQQILDKTTGNNSTIAKTKSQSFAKGGNYPFKTYPCGDIFGQAQKYIKGTTILSPSLYWRLDDLLVGEHRLARPVAQRGLSAPELVCNLRQLASNCLDPIRAQWPTIIISSGLRKEGSLGTSNDSDHDIGCAVDIQLKGVSEFVSYLLFANWIQKNIPYKQLLFEYETYDRKTNKKLDTPKKWIHIAFRIDFKNNTLIRSKLTDAIFQDGVLLYEGIPTPEEVRTYKL